MKRITDWLEEHGGEGLAPDALVYSDIVEEALDQLAATPDRKSLRVALQLRIAEFRAHQPVTEIQTAASRIHKLVAAVKWFTYIQKQIFDPFLTTKLQGEGTGLGLDTARRVVQQHRGSIDLESKPGKAEFTLLSADRTGEDLGD